MPSVDGFGYEHVTYCNKQYLIHESYSGTENVVECSKPIPLYSRYDHSKMVRDVRMTIWNVKLSRGKCYVKVDGWKWTFSPASHKINALLAGIPGRYPSWMNTSNSYTFYTSYVTH